MLILCRMEAAHLDGVCEGDGNAAQGHISQQVSERVHSSERGHIRQLHNVQTHQGSSKASYRVYTTQSRYRALDQAGKVQLRLMI